MTRSGYLAVWFLASVISPSGVTALVLPIRPRHPLRGANASYIFVYTPLEDCIKTLKLTKLGGSVAVVLPKAMLERLSLEAGDDVHIAETPDGLLITPFDPDFDEAMAIYERGARKFRNALRELAK